MSRQRSRSRLREGGLCRSPLGNTFGPSSATGKLRSALSNIFTSIGRKTQETQQQTDLVPWLLRSGLFQEADSERLKQHFDKLPHSYLTSRFPPAQVKEHMELLQEAARLKDGFVATRLHVAVEDDTSLDVTVSDSSCTSSAGGFSTLSSDGGCVCKLDVTFASGAHICRPDLAYALRQVGISVISVTIFDVSPHGSLGHFVAKVYRDDFSQEILENVFTSVWEQQKHAGPKWLPIGVRRNSGEFKRDGTISDRDGGSERGGSLAGSSRSERRPSPFRSHRRLKTASAGDVEGMLQVLVSDRKSNKKEDISKFILDPLKVELGPVIAVGASGEVRKGKYEGKDVAVKILKGCLRGKDSKSVVAEFRREVLTLMACGECPHLLQFHGIFVDIRSRMCIVTKFMEGGTLHDFLGKRNGVKLPREKLLTIATDIAAAMEFLHQNGITHRDLKSSNVLLDGEGHAVVGDFGVAKLKGERGEMTKEVGTYRWMAPEAFGTSAWPVTHKSDVYSYGIVLWELISLAIPFDSYTPVQAAVAVTLNGLRPTIPEDCPAQLKGLIERCWAKNPEDRPEFSDVVASLRVMV